MKDLNGERKSLLSVYLSPFKDTKDTKVVFSRFYHTWNSH